MTIRDELDDARAEGYNDGFETGFNIALCKVTELLENMEIPTTVFARQFVDSLKQRIAELSP